MLPHVLVPASIRLPEGADDEVRLLLWLRAVCAMMEHEWLRLRRAVVLRDEPDKVHGLLLGSRSNAAPTIHPPLRVTVEVDARRGQWCGEILVR